MGLDGRNQSTQGLIQKLPFWENIGTKMKDKRVRLNIQGNMVGYPNGERRSKVLLCATSLGLFTSDGVPLPLHTIV